MKLHTNAQTCPHCRFLIVSRVMSGQRLASVARDFQVSTKTIFKWISRFRAEGAAGLDDRSSRPRLIARRHLQPGKELNDAVFALLHTPPSDSGFNRTTWRLADLHSTLRTKGVLTTMNNLSAVIKQAGYQWKKARVTLTGSDHRALEHRFSGDSYSIVTHSTNPVQASACYLSACYPKPLLPRDYSVNSWLSR